MRRKRLTNALAAVSLLLAATGVRAEAGAPASELTLFGAWRMGGEVGAEDSDVAYEADDSPGYGLIWNHAHEANTQWEVYLSRQQTEIDQNASALATPSFDVDIYTLQLGGTYTGAADAVQPYLAMTVGGTHIRPESGAGEADTFLSGSIGLGLKFRPRARLGGRLEVRANGVLVRQDSRLFCQTGPDKNACAVELQGELFGQIEAFAGISLRF